jgi:mycoredoxin
MTAPVTMYTTTWCGYCVRLKTGLERAGIGYDEVNIELDETAAVRVMEVNGGNQTVPTLEFSDGSALTNPTVSQVQEKLASIS